MLTDEQIAAIRARCEAATAEPWEHVGTLSDEIWSDRGRLAEFLLGEDAAFCFHAREDMPALLAEVERLRAALERAQGRAHAEIAENANLRDLNDAQLFAAAQTVERLRAENAALREMVDDVRAILAFSVEEATAEQIDRASHDALTRLARSDGDTAGGEAESEEGSAEG